MSDLMLHTGRGTERVVPTYERMNDTKTRHSSSSTIDLDDAMEIDLFSFPPLSPDMSTVIGLPGTAALMQLVPLKSDAATVRFDSRGSL